MGKKRGPRVGGGGLNQVLQENMNGTWDLYLDKQGEKSERQEPEQSRNSRWKFVDDERRDAGKGDHVRDERREAGKGKGKGDNFRRRPEDVGPKVVPNKHLPEMMYDEDASSTTSTGSSSSADEHTIALSFGASAHPCFNYSNSTALGFGVIVYDLETIHDAERGTYLARGIHECSYDEQMIWKSRSQIIEFAAIEVISGRQICVQCRPEFAWSDVKSLAARLFAEDHGHDKYVKDESLPSFPECWKRSILPYLQSVAGPLNAIALIAHNGDNFDSYILEKELTRHGLMDGLPCVRHFDPVRSLKRAFGPDFGTGGMLTLGAIHQRHVPNAKQDQPLHQAMADCIMLLEIITHWVVLRALLAAEIAASFSSLDTVEEVCNAVISSLVLRASNPQQSAPNARSPAKPAQVAAENHTSHPSRAPRAGGDHPSQSAPSAATDAAPLRVAGPSESAQPSVAAKVERSEKANRAERLNRPDAVQRPAPDLHDLSREERRRLIRENGARERAMERAGKAPERDAERGAAVEKDLAREKAARSDWNGDARAEDGEGRGTGRKKKRSGRSRREAAEQRAAFAEQLGLPMREQPKHADRPLASAAEASGSGEGVQFQ